MKSGGEFWARAAMVAGLAAVVAGLHAAVLRAPGEYLLAGRYVGGIHLWLFWWWPHAFFHGLNPFHTRHLMYPDGVPLAFHTPITEALGGLLVNVFSPATGLNLTLMALFVLNGLSAFVFLRAMPVRRSAAVLGAGIFAFSHYTIVQHGFGQALVNTLYVNPLFAWALLRFREKPDRSAVRWLGIAAAALVLAGPYMAYCFGAMFVLGVAGHDALSGRRLFRAFTGPVGRAALVGLSAVAVGALALYFPLWRHYGDWEGGDQRISMVLASFIDMPSWHPSGWVQRLRPLRGAGIGAEENMAFLGWEVWALLAAGIAVGLWRRDPRFRLWAFLAGFSAVMCLGGQLRLAGPAPLPCPLPYALLERWPGAAPFRAVARVWSVGLLATSVLAALSFEALLRNRKSRVAASAVAAIFLFRFWEFDLKSLGGWRSLGRPPAVYDAVRADPEDFAVLPLPQAYSPATTETPVVGYAYMHYQTYHGRPLVLGSPSRHTAASLRFTEGTPFVYELTHPGVIAELRSRPLLAERLAVLRREGRGVLETAGIKYAIWHADPQSFSAAASADTAWLLEAVLGPPAAIDGAGNRLYRVYEKRKSGPGPRDGR